MRRGAALALLSAAGLVLLLCRATPSHGGPSQTPPPTAAPAPAPALTAAPAPTPAPEPTPIPASAEPELLIYDNDWSSAASASLLPLLASAHWRVLGLTTVSGDVWRDQGAAELRRFLEQVNATGIPVLPGAVFPLLNTRERMMAWEKSYGRIPWKGAWNNEDAGPQFHPLEPYRVVAPRDGMPAALPLSPLQSLPSARPTESEKSQESRESAAAFMVRQVRAHPHQITIYAAGPLTNLAQAIMLEPAFAGLAKRLVFCGANLTQLKRDGTVRSDFNLLFDPEAAAIVLGARWDEVISIGDVAEDALLTPELRRRLAATPGAAAAYLIRNERPGATLWDTLGAVFLADPGVARQTLDVAIAVDLGHGPFHGRARAWVDGNGPGVGERPVRVVRAIDAGRFADDVAAAARALP